jgi:hypothetical protein
MTESGGIASGCPEPGLAPDKRVTLRRLWLAGMPALRIAHRLGLTRGDVETMARAMKLPRDPAGETGRPWEAQDGELRRLFIAVRLPVAEIAARLKRTREAVYGRIRALDLHRPRLRQYRTVKNIEAPRVAKRPTDPRHLRKLRRCLGPCGTMFLSKGANHRICDACRPQVESLANGDDSDYAVARPSAQRRPAP